MNGSTTRQKNAEQVRKLIQDWAASVSAGDRAGILAGHAGDMLMFDFPNTVRGLEQYDRTWDFFYESPKGPIRFVPSELEVTAGEDVAFASCQIHCDGTSAGPLDLRLTVGLKKVDGEWTVIHEHHSVPTQEERFLDAGLHGTDADR
jgi:ketosteroid isomerase-like protein